MLHLLFLITILCITRCKGVSFLFSHLRYKANVSQEKKLLYGCYYCFCILFTVLYCINIINIILYITLRRINIPTPFLHPLNMQFKPRPKTNEKRPITIFLDKLLINCLTCLTHCTLMTSLLKIYCKFN